MERQVKEELSAVRDFLAGRTSQEDVPAASDRSTRQQVATELLVAMAPDQLDTFSARPDVLSSSDAEAVTSTGAGIVEAEQQQTKHADYEQMKRARKLFMDHGYFDEAVQDLRYAISPQQRAEAARSLGVVSDKRGTQHLVAAMFDNDPGVRNAAEEAMARMNGPTTSSAQTIAPASAGFDLEESRVAEASSSTQNVTARETGSHDLGPQGSDEVELQGSSGEGAIRSPESLAPEETADDSDNTDNTPPTTAGAEFDTKLQSETQVASQPENQQAGVSHETTQEIDLESLDPAQALKEADRLLSEEQSVREAAQQLDRQLAAAAVARAELEKEVVLSVERETSFRAEAATRRREEEELRKQADEEVEIRRSNESEALKAEQLTREQAETEAQWLAEEEARTRLERVNLRKAAEELVWQRLRIEDARREAEEVARRQAAKSSREEVERLHNAELTRLRNEEEALRVATDEAATRRADVEKAHRDTKAELERLTKERVQLAAAEAVRHADATRLRQEAKTRHEAEVTRLRSEEEALRGVAEQVAQKRAEVGAAHRQAESEIDRLNKERAQLATAEAARNAESERIREAEEKNRADHEQLRLELEGLGLVDQEVATRRAEVESARKKADEDAARLLETQGRIRAEEEVNSRVESERLQIEAEITQQVKTQQRLLEEARRRALDEQQRLEDEGRSQAEHEAKLRRELEQLRKNAEMTALQCAEEERQVRNQVDSLRIADAEARKRIEEAEARRRKSEDVYRLVAEKVQRVEAEAHMRALEEQQILAKLETVRRTAAVEAQARAEQEKRIKEEIEQFRKLEEVDRPRLEVASLQRTQAQVLFQQQRERAQPSEDIQSEANKQREPINVRQQASADEESNNIQRFLTVTPNERRNTVENLDSAKLTDEKTDAEATAVDDQSPTGVTATIQTYLNSVDPYKRAAAVAELARSDEKNAFELIVKCFDDHSSHVRNAAARALRELEPGRSVDLFNRALEEGSEERRRNIGAAIAGSGLAGEAIENLVGDNREETYSALLILFVMAKAGEVQPLVKAIEQHENVEVSRAVVKLLTLTGQTELADAALQRRGTGV